MAQVNFIHGDCREVLAGTEDEFDFVFADPPFGIDHHYQDFDDRFDDYFEFTSQWVGVAWSSCRGVLALHGPDQVCEMYLRIAAARGMRRIAWLNWHYRFGQCGRSNWIDARCHCLVFAKNETWTWNPDEVLVESDRVKYRDKRVSETDRGGKRLPGTVWGVPSDGPYWGRVTGNSKERRPYHPNQLPEVYLERLIRAYTNPGDTVLDPFAGSGTTAVVAKALGRDITTIDVSAESLSQVKERIEKGAVRCG